MSFVVIMCLLILISGFVFRLYSLTKSMEEAKKELQEISEDLFENRIVKLKVRNRKLEELLEAVNHNLWVIRSERRIYQEDERKLKEQIQNISHDLRTPLTAILGYLKMLDMENMSEEDREFLNIAIKKSYTLQELTGQFYELSRVTSGDFCLKLERIDAVRILKETCLEHYHLLENAGLMLTFPAFETPAIMLGNAEALARIFANLIQNSIRYAKSRLSIEIQEDEEQKSFEISFSNDISEEQEVENPEMLFERFYMQEHSRNHEGTGLGLTISKTLAEHMDGTIKAKYSGREEERILTFSICFPLKQI